MFFRIMMLSFIITVGTTLKRGTILWKMAIKRYETNVSDVKSMVKTKFEIILKFFFLKKKKKFAEIRTHDHWVHFKVKQNRPKSVFGWVTEFVLHILPFFCHSDFYVKSIFIFHEVRSSKPFIQKILQDLNFISEYLCKLCHGEFSNQVAILSLNWNQRAHFNSKFSNLKWSNKKIRVIYVHYQVNKVYFFTEYFLKGNKS